jgi:hypothetical protein
MRPIAALKVTSWRDGGALDIWILEIPLELSLDRSLSKGWFDKLTMNGAVASP